MKTKKFWTIVGIIGILFIGYRIAKPISETDLMNLIESGASAQEVETAIKKTRGKNHVRVSAIINANKDPDINNQIQSITKLHPIYTASFYAKDPAVINILVKNGVSVNPKIFNFEVYKMTSPIQMALKFNTTEGIYTSLVSNGAEFPDQIDKSLLLIDAIQNPNPNILQEYIKDGSVLKEVREKTKQGEYMAFYMAAIDKNYAYTKVYYLLAYGFNPNARSSKGNTLYKSLSQSSQAVDMNAYRLIQQYSK